MYVLVREIEEFRKIVIDYAQPLFTDTETKEDPGRTKTGGGLYGKIRLAQLYQEAWGKVIIVDADFIDLSLILDLIKPATCVFHNGSYDLHTINRYTKYLWLPTEIHDTMYAGRAIFFDKTKFNFYDCLEYTNCADGTSRHFSDKENQDHDWTGPISDEQLEYAALDVKYLAPMYRSMEEYGAFESVSYNLDVATAKFIVKVSRRGMPVNRETVRKKRHEYTVRLETALRDLGGVNPNSYVQVRKYLGVPKSDADYLDNLIMDEHPSALGAKLVVEGRHCAKALSYLEKYDRPLVYGYFQACAAITGRFSCTGGDTIDSVNLQQCPAYLQECFEAPHGQVFVYKDYSGVELRMATTFVGEQTMYTLYMQGLDLHTETAKIIFSTNDPTKMERQLTKIFNFGLIYGISVKALVAQIKAWTGESRTFKEVKQLVDEWFAAYPLYKTWHEVFKSFYNVHNYVDIQTAMGRKIRCYSLPDSFNFPIQGSSAEAQKMGLLYLLNRYQDEDLRNSIHDSNIMVADEDKADMWGERLSECMVDGWDACISGLTFPDLSMPHGYTIDKAWTFK